MNPFRLSMFPLILMLPLSLTQTAIADDDRMSTVAPLPRYQQECGSCHLAYPPGLLPAVSWQRIMQGLDRHYGVDATLEPTEIREISRWLQVNAGTRRKMAEAPPEDRISRAAWFVREHREIREAVWQRKSVGGRSQCQACHRGAERGDFEEDNIRIPR